MVWSRGLSIPVVLEISGKSSLTLRKHNAAAWRHLVTRLCSKTHSFTSCKSSASTLSELDTRTIDNERKSKCPSSPLPRSGPPRRSTYLPVYLYHNNSGCPTSPSTPSTPSSPRTSLSPLRPSTSLLPLVGESVVPSAGICHRPSASVPPRPRCQTRRGLRPTPNGCLLLLRWLDWLPHGDDAMAWRSSVQ
jgi:hypothetical protein